MRGRTRRRPSHSDAVLSLAQLPPGRRATIVGTAPESPPVVVTRLRQLGFRAAARVDVIRRAPLGDPTIYRVQDTEWCLRRREARLIEVVDDGAEDGDR